MKRGRAKVWTRVNQKIFTDILNILFWLCLANNSVLGTSWYNMYNIFPKINKKKRNDKHSQTCLPYLRSCLTLHTRFVMRRRPRLTIHLAVVARCCKIYMWNLNEAGGAKVWTRVNQKIVTDQPVQIKINMDENMWNDVKWLINACVVHAPKVWKKSLEINGSYVEHQLSSNHLVNQKISRGDKNAERAWNNWGKASISFSYLETMLKPVEFYPACSGAHNWSAGTLSAGIEDIEVSGWHGVAASSAWFYLACSIKRGSSC